MTKSTAVLPKAVYLQKAEAICERANEAKFEMLHASEAKVPSGKVLSESERVTILIPIGTKPMKQMTEELAALGLPNGDEKTGEAIVDAYEEGVRTIEAKPLTAVTGSAFVKGQKLANGYGIRQCGI